MNRYKAVDDLRALIGTRPDLWAEFDVDDTRAIEPPDKPPIDGRPGSSHDPEMEARVAVLEQIAKSTDAVLKEMRDDGRELRRIVERDFRLSIGVTVATAIGLAGIMAKGFHWF